MGSPGSGVKDAPEHAQQSRLGVEAAPECDQQSRPDFVGNSDDRTSRLTSAAPRWPDSTDDRASSAGAGAAVLIPSISHVLRVRAAEASESTAEFESAWIAG